MRNDILLAKTHIIRKNGQILVTVIAVDDEDDLNRQLVLGLNDYGTNDVRAAEPGGIPLNDLKQFRE